MESRKLEYNRPNKAKIDGQADTAVVDSAVRLEPNQLLSCYLAWSRPRFGFNPKRCGLLGGVLFGEMKFVLSNFCSSEYLSVLYES